MNLLRLTLVVCVCAIQVNLAVAQNDRCFVCGLIKAITLGLVDLNPEPAWDVPDEIDSGDLPSGLALNPICKGLVNVMTNALGDQIPPELTGVVESVECGCDFEGRDLKFGCNIPNPVCLSLDDLLGGGDDDGGDGTDDGTDAGDDKPLGLPLGIPLSTGKIEDSAGQVCGMPMYRGVLERPRRISGKKPGLKSTACVEISTTGSDATASAVSTLSKQICIKADHLDGVTSVTKIEACKIYVVRQNGTFAECASCTGCPDKELSIQFNCSNVDLDESPDKELFIPDIGGQCFGAGVMSTADIKSGAKGSYIPFLTPV